MKKSKLRIPALIGLIVLVAVVLGGLLFGNQIEKSVRGTITTYVGDLVRTSAYKGTNGKLLVEIADVQYNIFTGSVDVNGITASWRNDSTKLEADVRLNVPVVHASGLVIWDLLFAKGFALNGIDIDRPVIEMPMKQDMSQDSDTATTVQSNIDKDSAVVRLPRIPNANALLQKLLATLLPGNIKPLNIGHIAINDGSIVSMNGNMKDIDVRFDGISVVDSSSGNLVNDIYARIGEWDRSFESGKRARIRGMQARINAVDTTLKIDTALYVRDASMQVFGRGIQLSTKARHLHIDSFDVRPSVSDEEYFAQSKYKQDRFIIAGSQAELRNINVEELTSGRALRVENVNIVGFQLHVRCDYTRPVEKSGAKPGGKSRGKKIPASQLTREMPHKIFEKIPFAMQIDSITFQDAVISYTEKRSNWPKDAILEWSKVKIRVADVSTDTAYMNAHPLKINASSIFMHKASMDLTLSMPMNTGHHEFTASGSLSSMPMATVNMYLEIAENIKLSSGQLIKAGFQISVKDRTARGIVLPEYTNLSLSMLNKQSHKKGFWGGIESFIANWLVIKNDNVRGEDYRPGNVEYTLPQDAAIFQTLWFPVRKGLSVSVGF